MMDDVEIAGGNMGKCNFAMSNLLKIDNEYKNWITDILKRFKASQIKAAVKVNSEMLHLYWSIGKDLERMVLCQ